MRVASAGLKLPMRTAIAWRALSYAPWLRPVRPALSLSQVNFGRPRADNLARNGRHRSPQMRAMTVRAPGQPLVCEEREPAPLARGQVRIRVKACGVCRTDLHLLDGELPACRLPVIPGHEVVGVVVEGSERFAPGARVGVPWLGWTCGVCAYCRSGRENLCDRARFTGCHLDGGY